VLTKLTIQSFKSLEFVEAPLGVVNVFIGANGSGKTNLLEALGLLSAAAAGTVDDQALNRRGVRISPPSGYATSLREAPAPPPTKIVAEVSYEDGKVAHGIRAPEEHPVAQGEPDFWIEEQTWSELDGAVRWKGGRLVGASAKLLAVSEELADYGVGAAPSRAREASALLSDYGIFAPVTAMLRATDPDRTQRKPVGLAGGQLALAVRDLLAKNRRKFGAMEMDELLSLLDWVSKISVVEASRNLVPPGVPMTRDIIRFTDRWMAPARNQLSAYDASEGALYVLFALVLALHPDSPRLFAIEHVDQYMHPRLARATVRLFCQQMLESKVERQALITTHNPLVLDGLDLRDDRIRLFTVERDRKGATRVDRVPVTPQMLDAVESGLSLSNLWVMGRLGGAPDLF
jgi:hypothetical protein